MVDESQSTAYTTVAANPDGSWTETTSPTPMQARDGAGSWAPIDTTLGLDKAGRVVPGNVSSDVAFSGGGDTTAATMTVAGQKVSWLWPTTLPAPTLSGSSATYQVGASEQLVLTATATGFSEDVVLTAPPTSPADAAITLPMQTGTTTLQATDTTQLPADPSAASAAPVSGDTGSATSAPGLTPSVPGSTPSATSAATPSGTAGTPSNPTGAAAPAAPSTSPSSSVSAAPSASSASAGTTTSTVSASAGTGSSGVASSSRLVLKTGKGKAVLWAATPLAYDATATAQMTGATAGASPGAGAGHARLAASDTAPLDVAVTRGPGTGSGSGAVTRVRLRADWSWLTAPSTRYPVTIDPTFTSGDNGDTWVDNQYPNSNYDGGTALEVGDDAGTHVGRTLLWFHRNTITDLDGKDIVSATLHLQNYTANSCTAATIRAFRITSSWSTSGVTWNNQPSISSDFTGYGPAHGYSSACPAADASWDVTSIMAGWAAGSFANDGIELVAANESNVDTFRAYRASEADMANLEPRMTITYDDAPYVPSTVKLSPVTSYTPAGGTAMLYSSTATPTVSATVSDPDGGQVRGAYSFYTSKTGTAVGSCTTAYVASGSVASCKPAALANGVYYVRGNANDGTLTSAGASAWTTVTIAAGGPYKPTITCDNETNGTWAATAPGGSVSCAISAAAASYLSPVKVTYTIDGVTKTVAITQPTAGNPTVTNVTVAKSIGGHTITALATSPAGVNSNPATFGFGYGTLGLNAPTGSSATASAESSSGSTASAVVTTSGTVQVAATGPTQASGNPNAYVEWRLAGSGANATTGWTKGPALTATTDPTTGGLSFTGAWDTSSAGTATDPAVNSDGTTTTFDARTPQLLEMQVCADYTGGTECTWGTNAGNAGAGAPATDVLRVAHAFGEDYPTTTVPDATGDTGGQVALWTGEWQTSATDATLAAGHTSLSIDRTASSYAGPTVDPAGNVFGPGWTTDLTGADAGYAGFQVTDQTLTEGVITLDDGSGDTMVFAPSSDGTPNGTPDITRRTSASLATGTWLPVDAATAEAGVIASINPAGDKLTLTDPDGTTTVFTAQTAPTASTAAVFHPQSVTQPGDASATTYTYNNGLVTRIAAPVPKGVTCPDVNPDGSSGPMPAGCRAIVLNYATTTTATTSTPGDYANQVSSIDLLVGTGSGSGAHTDTAPVADYAYDTSGRLVSVTDPRPATGGLTTSYSYGTGINENNPVITSITPPGLTPIDYTYDTAGKLTQVTRQRDASDSPSGTADLATIAYNLPSSAIANPNDTTSGVTSTTLSGTGLPDLSDTAVAAWDQPAGPTYAAAVFGPDHPLSLNGSGDLDITGLSSDDWTYASASYADAEGREVNDADYGAGRWLLSDTEYDSLGNTVRELSNSDIAAVQDGTLAPQDAGTLTVYNAEVDGAPDASGNPTVLLPADAETTDTYDVARWVQLAGADGDTTTWARPHTHTTYDQGAPNAGAGAGIDPATGQDYALPTTVTKGAADPNTLDTTPGATEPADLQVDSITKTGYDNAVPVATGGTVGNGETSDTNAGWDQGLASSTTTVMDDSVAGGTAGAAPITTTTLYDAAGEVIATNQPDTVAAGNGPDAGTRQAIYYTAAGSSAVGDQSDPSHSTPDVAACDNAPGLDGLVCETRFAGNPATGTALVTTTSHYNDLDDATSTVETSGGTTRTTTTGYDADERKASTSTTVTGLTSSTPVPDENYGYDPATGLPTTTTPSSGAGGVITTGYDAWGRTKTYTTSAGTTTTSYDAAGNTATVTTPDGVTTTNTYDGGTGTDAAGNVERRGLLTSLTATATSGPNKGATVTESGAYDAAGNLTTEDLPGGLSISSDYDTAGQLTDATYSGDVTATDDTGTTTTTTPATPWIGWSQTYDPEGRVIDSWTPDGAALSGETTGAAATGYADAYSYDPVGRLVQVIDQTRTAGGGGLNADGTDPDTGTTPTDASCVIRQYGFDADGNRTSLTAIPTAADGTCQSTTPGGDTGVATTTTGYDPNHSDRVTTTGYAYDDLGRITTIPQAQTPEGTAYATTLAAGGFATAPGDLTLGYYDTDTVHTLTQAGQTTTYNLDATGRVLTEATGPTGSGAGDPGTSTITNGYTDTGDSPGYETTTTGTSTSTESYVSGLDGDLAATLTTVAGTSAAQIAVNDPHGDTVAQITLPATGDAGGLDDWSTNEEYGNPEGNAATTTGLTATNPGGDTATNATGGQGYGWLGAKTRPTLEVGLVLMGARLYNPATGTFTSTDPIYRGNTTPYAYPQDPINAYDLNGQWGFHSIWHAVTHVVSHHWQDAVVGAGFGACVVLSAGLCAGVSVGISIGLNGYNVIRHRESFGAGLRNVAIDGAAAGLGYPFARAGEMYRETFGHARGYVRAYNAYIGVPSLPWSYGNSWREHHDW